MAILYRLGRLVVIQESPHPNPSVARHQTVQGTMLARENLLRTVRFEKPETIPVTFHVNASCWEHYPHDALQEIGRAHV